MNCISIDEFSNIKTQKRSIRIYRNTVKICPGKGISIEKDCNKFTINCECSSNSSFTTTTYSGSSIISSNNTVILQTITLNPNTVNNFLIHLMALSTSNLSTFEEYDITYSYIGSIRLAGSYYYIYTGDFEVQLNFIISGNQLIVSVTGINENININYDITVSSSSF